MMKRMKQVLSAALAACMVVGLTLPEAGAGVMSAKAAADVTSGLVGYWNFDQDTDTGKLTNQSSGSYTAEIVGSGVTLKDDGGVSGGSAYFSQNASSHLKLNQIVNVAEDDFSVAMWVKYDSDAFDNISQNMNLLQQGGDGRTMLFLQSSLYYGTYLNGSNSLCTVATELGVWTHVVFTCAHDTQQVQFYLNGELATESTLSDTFYDGITDLLVGSHKSSSSGAAIKGYLDELRFYNTVVSADTVSALYDEYAVLREYAVIQNLIEDAEALDGSEDETAIAQLQAAIEAAKAITESDSAADMQNAYDALQEAMDAYELTITVKISVDTTDELREISDAMFGINHRYHNDGYSSWNSETQEIEEEFNEYAKEASFGSVRYPGGTVSNLFDWKRAIGDVSERKNTVHGLPDSNSPITPNFGVDEAMTWIYDDLDAEAIWVYGMGQGSASDAADLFEYLNAPNDGTNINGGVDWAAVRAANGHEEPYGVTEFEIGNEITYYSQTYWIDGKPSTQTNVESYIIGGTMTFGSTTRTVKDEDWRTSAAVSDGTANQVRYVKYDPVTEDSIRVYVGSTEWTVVKAEETDGADSGEADANALAALENYGAENVCVVEYPSGKIIFGDGTHGNIPASGQVIYASYETEQDGFVDYYRSLKDAAEQLGMEVNVYSCVYYEEFTTLMAQKGYSDLCDGIVIHPYSDNGIDGSDPDFYDKVLGRSQEHNITRVQALINRMEAAGMEDAVPVISEFGIYNYNTSFIRAQGHAVYIANEMIDYINLGTPYLNKHCLIDYPYDGDSLGPGSQCVIQAIKNDDGTVSFVSTPSAKMYSIFNNMTGNTEVNQTVTGNQTYYTYSGYDVPTVKILSTTDDEGYTYVVVVNNRQYDSTPVEISVDDRNLTDEDIEVWYLTSETVYDENTVDDPDNVDVVKTSVVSDGEALSYSLTPHSITAFKIAPETVDVTPQTSDGGSVSGDTQAAVGSVVTLTAEPDEGYEFVGWFLGDSDEPVSTDLEYTFIVTGTELRAVFAKIEEAQKQTEASSQDTLQLTTETESQTQQTEAQDTGTDESTALAKPKGLKAKKTKNGIRLTWKKTSGATGYIIYRSTKKGKGYKKIATITKNKKRYLDKKAKSGKTYYYKIKAYRTVNGKRVTSKYSKVVKVKR